jgi:hypothetical protein
MLHRASHYNLSCAWRLWLFAVIWDVHHEASR